MEETASNDSPPPERERSRSPPPEREGSRSPRPANPLVLAVEEAADIARRTCPVCVRVFDSPKGMWGHSWVHRPRGDQINSIPPPPPLGGGVAVGPGEGSTVAGAGVGGSGWHPWKIDSKDERDRTCPRCFKVFNSPKAMFGHLHVHYERSPSAPARRVKGESSSSQSGPPVALMVPPHVMLELVVPPVPLEQVDPPVPVPVEPPVPVEVVRPLNVVVPERGDADEDGGGVGRKDEDSPASIDLNRKLDSPESPIDLNKTPTCSD